MEKGFDFSKIDEIVANHENSAVNIRIYKSIIIIYQGKYLNT